MYIYSQLFILYVIDMNMHFSSRLIHQNVISICGILRNEREKSSNDSSFNSRPFERTTTTTEVTRVQERDRWVRDEKKREKAATGPETEPDTNMSDLAD